MFCPRCAAQNVDGVRFCRACGADISLVPQAMQTVRVPEAQSDELETSHRHRRRSRKHERGEADNERSFDQGVTNIFVGAAFLIVFLSGLILFRHGWVIWVWFIIPGLSTLGSGVSRILRARREREMLAPPLQTPTAMPPASRLNELPSRDTSEFLSPPTSVTEGTTRHLDATPRER